VPALDAMSLSTTSFDVAFAAANVGLAYVIALPLNEASCGAWWRLDREILGPEKNGHGMQQYDRCWNLLEHAVKIWPRKSQKVSQTATIP